MGGLQAVPWPPGPRSSLSATVTWLKSRAANNITSVNVFFVEKFLVSEILLLMAESLLDLWLKKKLYK